MMTKNAFKEAFYDSLQERQMNKNKNLDNSEIKVSCSNQSSKFNHFCIRYLFTANYWKRRTEQSFWQYKI